MSLLYIKKKQTSKVVRFLLYFSIGCMLLAVSGAVYTYRKNKVTKGDIKAPIPVAAPYQSQNKVAEIKPLAPPQTAPVSGAQTTLPKEVNLAVPFTSQAPYKKWDADHEEFCEEAAVLMAVSYLDELKSLMPADVEKKLQAIKDFEMQRFGYFEDTDAIETAEIIRSHFGRDEVVLRYDPSADDLRKLLAEGKVLLLPAAGRELKNPHFRGLGPDYHMIVIKGYTANGLFITNDPGTQFGKDYLYKEETIMRAMRDWNNGDYQNGRKVVIVVG